MAEGVISRGMAEMMRKAGAEHGEAALMLHLAAVGMNSFNGCRGCAHKGLDLARGHIDLITATVPKPDGEACH
jgi:hypothetical protein